MAEAARASKGATALQWAAEQGHAGVVELLLKSHRFQDADVNAATKFGGTALHAAAGCEDPSIARMLLNCARFQNANALDVRYRSTALHRAADRNHVAVML